MTRKYGSRYYQVSKREINETTDVFNTEITSNKGVNLIKGMFSKISDLIKKYNVNSDSELLAILKENAAAIKAEKKAEREAIAAKKAEEKIQKAINRGAAGIVRSSKKRNNS